MMKFEFKTFDELTNYEIYELLKIRSEVFVVEQKCFYNDPDNKDLNSLHLLIRDTESNNEIVGCLRILRPGVSYEAASLGRVLISPKYRELGLGKKLINSAINYSFNELKYTKITIGAQLYLEKFYSDLGFVTESDPFDDAGIPHIDMSLKK